MEKILGLIFLREQVMKRQLKVVENALKSHRQTLFFYLR